MIYDEFSLAKSPLVLLVMMGKDAFSDYICLCSLKVDFQVKVLGTSCGFPLGLFSHLPASYRHTFRRTKRPNERHYLNE